MKEELDGVTTLLPRGFSCKTEWEEGPVWASSSLTALGLVMRRVVSFVGPGAGDGTPVLLPPLLVLPLLCGGLEEGAGLVGDDRSGTSAAITSGVSSPASVTAGGS